MKEPAVSKLRATYFAFYLSTVVYASSWLLANIVVVFLSVPILLYFTAPGFLSSLLLVWVLIPKIRRTKPILLTLNQGQIAEDIAKLDIRMNEGEVPSQSPLVVHVDASSTAVCYLHKNGRVIQFGWPLFALLTRQELLGVAAHELAHHFHGDTDSGRVLKRLDSLVMEIGGITTRCISGAMVLPFRPVLKWALAKTRQISREVELDADLAAASVVGRKVFVSGLRKVLSHSISWSVFLNEWFGLVLEAEVVGDVFALFEFFTQVCDLYIDEAKFIPDVKDVYNTHPSLQERLESLKYDEQEPETTRPESPSIDHFMFSEYLYTVVDQSSLFSKSSFLSWDMLYQTTGERLLAKYSAALLTLTWSDLLEINFHFGRFSSEVFSIRKFDNHDSEVRLLVFLASYILLGKLKLPYKIGFYFAPIVETQGTSYDIGDILAGLFRFEVERAKNFIVDVVGVDLKEVLAKT